MVEHISDSYNALSKVFKEKTYSSQALFSEKISPLSSRIILGVLEKNIYLDYIIKSLCDKEPKDNIFLILKIGSYMLLFLDNIPDYAIVNECVNFAKSKGKSGVSGFINAVLKKVAAKQFKLPSQNDPNYLSITYSKPKWFVDRLINEYGLKATEDMLKNSENVYDNEHVRISSAKNKSEVIADLKANEAYIRDSLVGGVIVENNEYVKKLFKYGVLTYQSPSSMIAVQGLNPKDGATILDLCSAPGGKSVYIAELCPNSKVVSCDIYEHRIKLIQSYAKRMNVKNIETKVQDATIFNKEFINKFDYVLVDAPCTCFGTFIKHPDVFLMHDEKAINNLSITQTKILQNALQYLSKNGRLVYSTCTLFKKENEYIVKEAIKDKFELETMDIPIKNNGQVRILPMNEWDGFFVARIKRK